MTRVHEAEPEEAAAILNLVRSDFARLDPTLRDKSATQTDVAAFSRRLENPGDMRRWVAVGKSGIEAYMKIGPWTMRDELTFSGVPEILHKPVVSVMGHLGWFRSTATGLFTLATPDGKLAYNDAIDRLVEESGLLSSVDTLYIPTPNADTKLKAFVEQIGAFSTERTTPGLQICPTLSVVPMPATLWRREKQPF